MKLSRVSVVIVALAALGACKKDSDAPKPETRSGTGTGTGSATATVAADAAPAPANDGPITRPYFFVAEKDGKQVHLLGTFHIGVDSTRLPAVVWDAFRASKTLAVETNILDPALLGVAQRSDGKTLEEELGPEYWKKLSDLVGANLVDGMKNMTAAAASTVVQVKYLPQTQPMDLAFLFEAKKSGKELRYLEEASLQAALFDRWMDAGMLKATLDSAGELEAKTQELLGAYVSGDGDAMIRISMDKEGWAKTGRSEADFEQMREEMLYARNRSWIPAIEQMAADGGGFVAVGAAHLVGTGSVVELLEANGWKVTRIGG